MITLTCKVQIYPSVEQKELILDTIKAYCASATYCAKIAVDKNIDSVHRLVGETYVSVREKFGLKSQMAQSAARSAMNGVRAARKNLKKSWVRCNFNRPEYDLVYNSDYRFDGDKISIGTLSKFRMLVDYEKNGSEKCFLKDVKLGTARLIVRHNKFYMLIPVTLPTQEFEWSNITGYVGIDMGLNFIATVYDSKGMTYFYKGKKIKRYHQIMKSLRSSIQKKETKSSRALLRRIGARESRWISEINHKISKDIIGKYPAGTVFIVEDLNNANLNLVKKVGKDLRYNISSWSYYDLRAKLTYKARLKGSVVIAIKPAYTSQTCPICGYVDKNNRDKQNHVFKCGKCSYTTNDDRVAAMNILNKGIELIENGLEFKK